MYQVSCIKNPKGFTLIESLVFLFLFAVISATFLQTYATGTYLIIDSKNRLGATALANQKMEIIRSIAYTSIGTTTGIPAGNLSENEVISVNTTSYTVHTFVQYVDDAFDGTAGSSPADTIPTDYKRVRITVSWGRLGEDQTVVIFGNFSPNGVETSSGGGVLSINVLDSSGSGITGTNVNIVNASEGINFTGSTDATGNIMLPGAPAGVENYVLTLSKSGYYGATTYPAYPTTAYNPTDVHASVAADVLNQKTLVIDQSSAITLTTEDPFGTAIPSISYTLSGGRVLGTDAVTGANVYGFAATGSTNASGEVSFSNESSGVYTVGITSAAYDFFKLSPETAQSNEFAAGAGVTTSVSAILLDKSIGSVRVNVRNAADSSGLAGASVHLTNATLLYDATVVTDQYGFAYFPSTLPALSAGTYDISVTLTGYGNVTDTVNIGSTLETKTINMTAN